MLDNIPEELKRLNKWVCWVLKERSGKSTKIPINPATGGHAMSNTSTTWTDYWTAHDRMVTDNLSGIGFVFDGDGIAGIDIDDCRDPETGQLTDVAKDIIRTVDSYTEISQSGRGIHILCQGKLPTGRRRKGPVEMYETGRYFCMTGDVIDDAHMEIEERTDQLTIIHDRYVEKAKKEKPTKKAQNSAYVSIDDEKLIETAMSAKNGDLFTDLMNGNWQGRYKSQSEADIALCNILAFYCRCDIGQMQRIFRRSGLFREKWSERRGEARTYGEITIQRAVADCESVYTPPSERRSREYPPEMDRGLEYLEAPAAEVPSWVFGPYNDMWNTERMFGYCGDKVRYCRNQGAWYIWNGSYWQRDELDYIRTLADQAITDLNKYISPVYNQYGKSEKKENKKKFTEFVGWISKSRNTGRRNNMIQELGATSGVAVLPEYFDNNELLFNCNNGTVDLRTGEIRPFTQEDLITKMSPVEYVPGAKAPLWETFLDRIFDGNRDLIDFMQRSIGYGLTGSNKEQCMFVCHGMGANGKSTLINVIQDVMGNYARGTNFSTFAIKNDNNTNDIARLAGSRFVSAIEAGENKWMNAALIKQLTGGDKISARFLHKEFFEFVPTFKIWMGVNHKPSINETDHGTWRRIRLIPFEVTISDEEKDEDLPVKLRQELPGILAWAVQGCLMWQKEGLNPPDEVSAATEAYRSEMDILQQFLSECTEQSDDSYVSSGDLYSVYKDWCQENGIRRPMTSTKFGVKIQERGIEKDRNMSMRYWHGIKLTDYGKQKLYYKYEGVPQKEPVYEQDELPWP